jgi:hypothetical protein
MPDKPHDLTTEQLMDKLIQCAKDSTPAEKAAARQELDRAFGKR